MKFKPVRYLSLFIYRLFKSGLNGRSIFGLVFNFALNFSPVFIWLSIFKNAGLIPKEIRPKIYVTLIMDLDQYLYALSFPGLLFAAATIALAYLLYTLFYTYKYRQYDQEDQFQDETSIELEPVQSSASSDTLFGEEYPMDFMDVGLKKKLLNNLSTNRPLNCFYLAPPILLASSYFLLNFADYCKQPITTPRDLVAWFSYVLLHFLASLFTAIWLYVFHAPGALATFSYCLGLQNICGVITHLLFPNAPPWFIHNNGVNATADYDMPGYAAGLTRVDLALGTHLNSSGFHASPIVFGAFPSLHSAMAVLVFFFVSYYSRWTVLKVLAGCFVALQWWATIYLDHHWRLDLFAGMLYSIFFFTLFTPRLARLEEQFITARLNYDFKKGSNMGMRVFRNTRFQGFFDPYA